VVCTFCAGGISAQKVGRLFGKSAILRAMSDETTPTTPDAPQKAAPRRFHLLGVHMRALRIRLRNSLALRVVRSVVSQLWAGLVHIVVRIWPWTPLSFFVAILVGIGVSAMYGDQYLIAATLFFFAISLIVAKAITEAKSHEKRMGVVFVILIAGVVSFYGSLKMIQYRESQATAAKKHQQPTSPGKWRIEESGTASATVKSWGTMGTYDVYAVVDASQFLPLADEYQLMMICRALDNKIDHMDDTRIDKSALYSIRGTDQTLQLTMSQSTMRRLIPQGWVNIYVLLVPIETKPAEFRNIGEFTKHGAKIIANPGMMVHSTTEPPKK
jgi:hypothetical protein